MWKKSTFVDFVPPSCYQSGTAGAVHVSETLGNISEEVHVNLQPGGPHAAPPSFRRHADSLPKHNLCCSGALQDATGSKGPLKQIQLFVLSGRIRQCRPDSPGLIRDNQPSREDTKRPHFSIRLG